MQVELMQMQTNAVESMHAEVEHRILLAREASNFVAHLGTLCLAKAASGKCFRVARKLVGQWEPKGKSEWYDTYRRGD